LIYVLIALPVLLIAALVYASRRQATATLVDAPPEPDVDLTYRPPVPAGQSNLREILEKPRDPALAKLSHEELVLEVLRECYDPEIPLNIVDLGLVYEVSATSQATRVKMSLTAPGCPSGEEIKLDVKGKLQEAGFPDPKVEVVWEPQWTAHRISPEGRKKLGIDENHDGKGVIPQHPDPGTANAESA
jgi:metal-sulfur cluster biosynthetic enzyme